MVSLSNNRIVYAASLKRFEVCFAVLGLLFFSDGLTNVLQASGAAAAITPLRYTILLGTMGGLVFSRHQVPGALKNGAWAWPLFLLASSSVLWSINPAVTFEGIRADLIPITLFGIYFSVRFSRKEIFQIVYVMTLIASIVSIFYAIAIPSIGQHPLTHRSYPGAWKGIFTHKNALGVNLIVTSICLELKILYGQRKYLFRYVGLYLLIAVEAILSKSLAALVVSTLVLGILLIYKQLKWRGKVTIFIIYCLTGGSIVIGAAVTAFWVPIVSSLGKDPTLSARTLIWDHVLNQHLVKQPILGFGRGSFWKNPAIFKGLHKAVHHVPAHAHNGYVDLLLDLGFVGLGLFLLSFVVILVRSVKLAYQATSPEDVWPLALIVMILISNVAESLLMRGASLTWLLYITAYCSGIRGERVSQGLVLDYLPPSDPQLPDIQL